LSQNSIYLFIGGKETKPVSKVAARAGRNPRTGEALEIAAYNQPKFKVGQKLKDAVNPK
jgi:DNA-binding protein HU-beta